MEALAARLGPITRGKLRGIEMLLASVEADEHLGMVSDIGVNFGGPAAQAYMRGLHRTRRAPAELRAPPRPKTPAEIAAQEHAGRLALGALQRSMAIRPLEPGGGP